jgi:hypothetical protein
MEENINMGKITFSESWLAITAWFSIISVVVVSYTYHNNNIPIWLFFSIPELISEAVNLIFFDFIFTLMMCGFVLYNLFLNEIKEEMKGDHSILVLFLTFIIYCLTKIFRINNFGLYICIFIMALSIYLIYYFHAKNNNSDSYDKIITVIVISLMFFLVAGWNFDHNRNYFGYIKLLNDEKIMLCPNYYIAKSNDSKILIKDAYNNKIILIQSSNVKEIQLETIIYRGYPLR